MTVLEREDKAGGLLRYGIPNMKLEKQYIDRRVAKMEQEGIRFQYNHSVHTAKQSFSCTVTLAPCKEQVHAFSHNAGHTLLVNSGKGLVFSRRTSASL